MSWGDVLGTLLPYVVISYAVVAGFVAFVLTGVQEGIKMSERKSRFGIERWSQLRLIAMSALLTVPSLIVFILIGVFLVA